MTGPQFYLLQAIALILLFATPQGQKITQWMAKEKEIVCGIVGVIVFTLQAYVMVLEYYAYLPVIPVLCCGIMSIPLAVLCFAFTLKTMWAHGYRPIWYR